LVIDLVHDGPHILVAGTTGSGKSELLRTLIASLAATVDTQRVNFLLIDYKGGSAFDRCAALPHTVGVVRTPSAWSLISTDASRAAHSRVSRPNSVAASERCATRASMTSLPTTGANSKAASRRCRGWWSSSTSSRRW
jgi:S-DNA-T family DNA segregation ATPase FtsK/SpoIIIE